MTFDNPILFFLCSIGVFNGFLVSIYFLFFTKEKRIQNTFFGLMVTMLSLRIAKSVYVIFSESRDKLILQIGLSACFLIGVSLFYYIKSSLDNKKQVPLSWKLHYLILVLLIVGIGLVRPYQFYDVFWNHFFVYFIYSVWFVYLVLTGFTLKDVISKLFQKAIKVTASESWLLAVFLGNVLIFSAYILGYFYLYLIGTITFSVVFYVLLIFLLSKNNRDKVFKDIPQKYKAKKITNEEANRLEQKLKEIMEQKMFYKNTNIKLADIAKELNITQHQLSQFLNDNLGKSFALFINEYRIEEAKKILKENNQFTLEAIGFEAGFSSKSNFYATFKKMVGVTPSVYRGS